MLHMAQDELDVKVTQAMELLVDVVLGHEQADHEGRFCMEHRVGLLGALAEAVMNARPVEPGGVVASDEMAGQL